MTFDRSVQLCRRNDVPMHYRVAIACSITDTKNAADYMAFLKVPFDVAHRVLLRPSQRRGVKV